MQVYAGQVFIRHKKRDTMRDTGFYSVSASVNISNNKCYRKHRRKNRYARPPEVCALEPKKPMQKNTQNQDKQNKQKKI